MLRILVITPGVLPVPPVLGGAVENLIARLQGELKDEYEFHYVSVAIPPDRQREDKRFSNATFHIIESINPLNDFRPDNHFELQESDKWLAYEKFCVETVMRIRPDIIHIHNEARLAIPIRQVTTQAKIICHLNDEVVTRLHKPELRALASSLNLLLSCSQYIFNSVNRVFEVYGAAGPPHEIFYNFVDLDEFNKDAIKPDVLAGLRTRYNLGNLPVIVFIGRMIEQKGPHLALRAIRWANARGARTKILFVGAPWYSRNNPTPWLDYLHHEVEELGDDVVFTGYVDHADIAAHYLLGDIAAVPSIWDDPSPFVAYEAQAMSRPVIGSTRGGIPEIIEDRVTGRCIDVFNVPLFGEILASWISDLSEREWLGRNGRARIGQRFSLKQAAEQMDQIYRSLISSR